MITQTETEINDCRDKAMELLALIQPKQPGDLDELVHCLTVCEFMVAALVINVRPVAVQEQVIDDTARRAKHWIKVVKAQNPDMPQ